MAAPTFGWGYAPDRSIINAMKNLQLLLLLNMSVLGTGVLAQPQWRFHLAFEDATGARDTIWFVYDTTATLGSDQNPQVDTTLGEGRMEMDLEAFNVWVPNWDMDSTKTVAYPYWIFPIHGSYVYAFNYEFPVTLRWDTALFWAGYLPNPAAINTARMDCAHFFSFNNDPYLQAYNMLLDDSVAVELMFPNDALFPLSVQIGGDASAGMEGGFPCCMNGGLSVHPNPVVDRIRWYCTEPLRAARVLDLHGRSLRKQVLDGIDHELDLSNLATGIYILEGISVLNHLHHAKFIKQD